MNPIGRSTSASSQTGSDITEFSFLCGAIRRNYFDRVWGHAASMSSSQCNAFVHRFAREAILVSLNHSDCPLSCCLGVWCLEAWNADQQHLIFALSRRRAFQHRGLVQYLPTLQDCTKSSNWHPTTHWVNLEHPRIFSPAGPPPAPSPISLYMWSEPTIRQGIHRWSICDRHPNDLFRDHNSRSKGGGKRNPNWMNF